MLGFFWSSKYFRKAQIWHATAPSTTASAEEWQVSGSEVFNPSTSSYYSTDQKASVLDTARMGGSLLMSSSHWRNGSIDKAEREREGEKHVSALNLEQHVRTNCMIHSLRACYRAHYLVKYLLPWIGGLWFSLACSEPSSQCPQCFGTRRP